MHFEQAGDTDRAIRYMMAAARFAYERNAITESFELYGRAAQLLPAPTAEDDNETIMRRVRIKLGPRPGRIRVSCPRTRASPFWNRRSRTPRSRMTCG